MSNSVMNSYQIDRQIFPLTLYRVDYPGSQTTYFEHEGFQASGDFTPHRVNGLRNSVGYHLDWKSRKSSPFISTFSNREHAYNWAQIWSNNNSHTLCQVVEIVLEARHGVTVFGVANLVSRLSIPTTLALSQYRSEYLCFRRIPPEAIVGREDVLPEAICLCKKCAGERCDYSDGVYHFETTSHQDFYGVAGGDDSKDVIQFHAEEKN